MADLESCSRIELRSVIKLLVAEQRKPSEIFRRMSDVYEETCFSQKNVHIWAKLSKEGGKNVFDKDRPGRSTGMRTPTMIKSVDDIIPTEG